MKTVHLTPQLWAYKATDADVLPVEAQALAPAPTIFAWLNAADMPLSLNEPEGFRPSYCKNKHPSSISTYFATASLGWRIVWPSPMVTLYWSSQKLSRSRNRQTPDRSSRFCRVAQRLANSLNAPGTAILSQL